MNNDRYARNGTRNAGQQELLSYLGKLGLEQGDMAKCLRYLDDHLPDDLIQVKNSIDLTVGPVAPKLRNTASKIRNVGLYLAEEQQVLRGPYESYFGTHSVIKLLGSSEDLAAESLFTAAMAVNPDVILLGVKTLRPAMLESLNDLREEYSEVGLVLLVSSYDRRAFKSLRSLPIGGAMGTAYLLKHTIDTMEQVSGIIRLVAEGRIIVDPKVMAGLIDTEQTVEASRGAILNNLPAMDTWDVDPPYWKVRSRWTRMKRPVRIGPSMEIWKRLVPSLRTRESVSTGLCSRRSYVWQLRGSCPLSPETGIKHPITDRKRS